MAKTTQKTTPTLRPTDRTLLAQRITEKAAIKTSDRVYTFDVAMDANKVEIKKAIKEIYKVAPLKVNIVRSRSIKKVIRGKMGTVRASKKAMVYLKEGDSIEL